MNWKTNRLPRRFNSDDAEGVDITKIFSIAKSNENSEPLGNKIYFYQDIDRDSILSLNQQIDSITKQLKSIQFTYNLAEPLPIELHICSDGGDVYAATAAVDKIINNPVPINTYCEGLVASAATLISVVGKKRYITKNSCMLIHQVSSGLWGSFMQFKDEIKNLESVMKMICGIYMDRTKYTQKELDEILTHDVCLSSAECLKKGLVDVIE